MQSLHLKKSQHINLVSFILVLFIFLLSAHNIFAAERINVTGNFPNFAVTNKIILKPRSSIGNDCIPGTLYVANTGEIKTCGQINVISDSVWTKVGDYIFTTDDASRPNLQMAIGENNTPGHFTIWGKNAANEPSRTIFRTKDGDENTGLEIRTEGTFTDAENNTGYIDFHVGDLAQDYDGRIIYHNTPTGLKGLALFGGFLFTPNIWINAYNHRVGIGTLTPSESLDIIGDIETNKIYVKPNVVDPAAELKVGYSASGGGYYAVYAP